jgi:hypothetical protein
LCGQAGAEEGNDGRRTYATIMLPPIIAAMSSPKIANSTARVPMIAEKTPRKPTSPNHSQST